VDAYLPKEPETGKETHLIWHAKLAVFSDKDGSVLAIAGRSNFTGASMFGPSEERFLSRIERVNVEGDAYFWRKSSTGADYAMDDALNYWARDRKVNLAFDDENFDAEVEKLIQYTYSSILKAQWTKIP